MELNVGNFGHYPETREVQGLSDCYLLGLS